MTTYEALKTTPKQCWECKQAGGEIISLFDYEGNGEWIWLHRWEGCKRQRQADELAAFVIFQRHLSDLH